MQLIDEDGNLFGAVNVIDALAIVLLLAVVVAGVAVVGVLSDDAGEPETRYATVDLGEQPAYVVDQIEAGDEMSPEGFDQNVTVTDVYVTTPAENASGAEVTVRTEVEGELVGTEDEDAPVFEFAGERLRVGDELELDTPDYGASGQVTSLETEGESLPVETEPVLLEGTLSATAADEIEDGDTVELGPHTVATVASVQTYPAGDDRYRVHLGAELEALRDGGSLTFGGQTLTVGSQLSLTADAYTFEGEIVRRGATELDSEPETRYATLDLGEQPEYVIDRVEAGDAMYVGDERLTVTDVHVSPSESDAGHVVVRAEVAGHLVERPDRSEPIFRFAGDHLRVGDGLELDVDEYAADGEVTSLDHEGDALSTGETPVVLETTVSERTAEEISEGDAFDLGPHTVATVTSVQPYPIGDDQYRVHLGAELDTLERGSTTLFAGEAVTVDRTLTLSTGTYEVDADVLRTGTTDPPGEEMTTTAELKLENVDPDVAAGLEAGMTETVGGETLATIETVESQPAEVVLESEDGDIHLREHPTNEDVRLTVSLSTLATDSGLAFHGESLREDETIVLDFGTKFVEPTVVEIDPED